MKYVGENALKKWTSLVKSDIKKKLDKNQGTANSGKILGVDVAGEVVPTDTEVATLVDIPNGLVKGDGTTLSAAVAGTDYIAPSELDEKLAANGLPFEVKVLETICENIELNPTSNTYTFPTALTLTAGDSYHLKYKHYTKGELDASLDRISYVIPGTTRINWVGENGKKLVMTATGLTDTRVITTDTKSIISLYKIESTIKKDLEDVEMRSEGIFTSDSGVGAHAEGIFTSSEDTASHAEGYLTTSSNLGSHAEGYGTLASNASAHAEGTDTQATGNSSHAEGTKTTATGSDSHAEGLGSDATGNNSHAEGSNTLASGNGSHAEGSSTNARANYSHAEGMMTEATTAYSHVQGMYNVRDTAGNATTKGKYAHIVGNGTASNLSNAHTLDWDGNAWFAGDVYTGGTAQDNGATKLMATPTGGTTGQVLTKTADSSKWADAPKSLPDGGTAGDAPVKSTDGGSWETPVEASLVEIMTKSETEAAINAKITASTTDLTAGTSPLATNSLYVVYE